MPARRSSREDTTKGENVYVIDRIVGTKLEGGNRFYEVKWLDYDDAENTWEPIAGLSEEIIAEYNDEEEKRSQGEVSGCRRDDATGAYVYRVRLMGGKTEHRTSEWMRVNQPALLVDYLERHIEIIPGHRTNG